MFFVFLYIVLLFIMRNYETASMGILLFWSMIVHNVFLEHHCATRKTFSIKFLTMFYYLIKHILKFQSFKRRTQIQNTSNFKNNLHKILNECAINFHPIISLLPSKKNGIYICSLTRATINHDFYLRIELSNINLSKFDHFS